LRLAADWAGNADDEVLAQLIDAVPTPELAAQFVDECGRMLDMLGNEDLLSIALWQVETRTHGAHRGPQAGAHLRPLA